MLSLYLKITQLNMLNVYSLFYPQRQRNFFVQFLVFVAFFPRGLDDP